VSGGSILTNFAVLGLNHHLHIPQHAHEKNTTGTSNNSIVGEFQFSIFGL
jgi:hypothetical protein